MDVSRLRPFARRAIRSVRRTVPPNAALSSPQATTTMQHTTHHPPSAVANATMGTSSNRRSAYVPTTRLPWCCTATIGGDRNGHQVRIEQPSSFLDMSQWMKGIEQSEGRELDAVGTGVYDAWRCDRVLTTTMMKPLEGEPNSSRARPGTRNHPSRRARWNQWGADFHLDRLSNSYREAARLYGESGPAPLFTVTGGVDQSSIDRARLESRRIIDEMLREADDRLSRLSDGDDWPAQLKAETTNESIMLFQLVRVTLLWSTLKAATTQQTLSSPSQTIVVRGHACYTGPIQDLFEPHPPITVSIASHSPMEASSGAPSRANQNPHLKVAKWTRVRQKIARPPGVVEVLLTRRREDVDGYRRVEILEGLSSNVFVVYNNGAIRTATDGVLHGYVRELVLECLEVCGLTFDPEPIWLAEEPDNDGSQRWSEVFITSSSRLIHPVSTVLVPEGQADNEDGTSTSYHEYWKAGASTQTPQKWRCLLDAILRKGGYIPGM
jgi:Amino-transferase class IV